MSSLPDASASLSESSTWLSPVYPYSSILSTSSSSIICPLVTSCYIFFFVYLENPISFLSILFHIDSSSLTLDLSSVSHWLILAYSWFVICFTLTHLRLLLICHLLHIDSSSLTLDLSSASHWLIFAYSWFVICFTLTHLCLLLIRHPTSFLLILFYIDTSLLTHCSTLYYINPKYLPCIS